MERKTFGKKPQGWGSKTEVKAQAKQMSSEVEPNRARIEAKIAEMKAGLEVKYKTT